MTKTHPSDDNSQEEEVVENNLNFNINEMSINAAKDTSTPKCKTSSITKSRSSKAKGKNKSAFHLPGAAAVASGCYSAVGDKLEACKGRLNAILASASASSSSSSEAGEHRVLAISRVVQIVRRTLLIISHLVIAVMGLALALLGWQIWFLSVNPSGMLGEFLAFHLVGYLHWAGLGMLLLGSLFLMTSLNFFWVVLVSFRASMTSS